MRSGSAIGIAVTRPQRPVAVAEIPTLAESGVPGYEREQWRGIVAPARTPRDIIDKFHDAGIKLLAEPSMQESLTKLGVEPFPMTPRQMDTFVAREIAENLELIKAAGINP